MTQRRSDNALFSGLLPERGLGSGRLRATMRLYFPWIAIPRQRRELLAGGATEHPLERPSRHPRQLPDGMDVHLGQPRRGDRPDAPQQLDRQVVQKIELSGGIDNQQAIGFGDLRGNLRQVLGAGHADRDRKTKLRPHTAAYCARDFSGRAEQMRASRDVGEGLVDGNPLHERGEIIEHLDGGIAQPLVVLEMAIDEDQLRTKLSRPPPGHAAANAEGLGLI
jgi:hypothetical protein